jgi:hypothetical protein
MVGRHCKRATKLANDHTAGQYAISADELNEDMTRSDFLYVLENLKFGKQGGGSKQILLNKGVRDYLVRALSR